MDHLVRPILGCLAALLSLSVATSDGLVWVAPVGKGLVVIGPT